MSALKQIVNDIRKTKGITIRSVCMAAGVSYVTVLNAINHGSDIRVSTLSKLSDVIDKRIVLIDKDI